MNDPIDRHQRIRAQAFDAPDGSDSAKESHDPISQEHSALGSVIGPRWWQSQANLILAVFALLAIAAFLLVNLTPPPTLPGQQATVVATDGSLTQVDVTASTPETPWDEARRAQARTDSQDVLSELLENKKVLEAKGVVEWAPERYQATLALADAGDSFYKQQDYQQAIENYQAAAQGMLALNELVPDILKAKVSDGLQAIDDGKTQLAQQAFKQALILDANNIDALSGLGRANTLDDVLVLVNAAQQGEQLFLSNDELATLQAANEKYQQALAIDSQLKQAKKGAQRVTQLLQDKRYRLAMSQGFNALFARQYSSAKKAFSTALQIKPNDATARSAYQQSLASDRSSSLSSVLANAKAFEQAEEWSKALSNYQAVLQRDPNQVSAKLGQIRSRVRSELDDKLESVLADPLALSKATAKARADAVLQDARAISRKGARLSEQIAQIEMAIAQLNTSIKVSFSSDQLTNVSLSKAGASKIDLGTFSSKNLALKPGRYVLNGSRLGFRDVRQEIVLQPGLSGVQTFTIRCNEPIAGSAQQTMTTQG